MSRITTTPSGAHVAIVPIDPATNEPCSQCDGYGIVSSDPVAAIADALGDADPERAVALLVELARVDPYRAESVLEIMRLGIEVALARDAE